jgi:hypothetical protein
MRIAGICGKKRDPLCGNEFNARIQKLSFGPEKSGLPRLDVTLHLSETGGGH